MQNIEMYRSQNLKKCLCTCCYDYCIKTIKLQISEYSCWLPRYYRRQKLHYRGNPSTAYSIPTATFTGKIRGITASSPLPCSSL